MDSAPAPPGLRIAIPSKGRLAEDSLALLKRTGLRLGGYEERRLYANLGGKYSIIFARAEDIPIFVQDGVADAGITGYDLVMESSAKVEVALRLNFGKCRLIAAVPESSPIQSVADLRPGARVATAFPNLTGRFFSGSGKAVEVVPLSGATEIAPHIGIADLITDLVETGSTLKTNRLRPIETLLESSAVFIANRERLKGDGDPLPELIAAVESVMNASEKRYLMANVPRKALDEARALVPGVSGPTIMNIMGNDGMVAIHAVVGEAEVNGIITVLKRLGATGILILPIERMVV